MRRIKRFMVVLVVAALLLAGWSLFAGWRTERAQRVWDPHALLVSPSAVGSSELTVQPGERAPGASHLFPLRWQLVPSRLTLSAWTALVLAFGLAAARKRIRSRRVPLSRARLPT